MKDKSTALSSCGSRRKCDGVKAGSLMGEADTISTGIQSAQRDKPELLSPAGSYESAIAAINGGADAIYMGGSRFNARMKATNFTDEEMARIITIAKSKNIRTYITLNTLIKNDELPELLDYLNTLYRLEITGLILCDPGLNYLLRKYYPKFERHGSTQMTITGLYGAKLLEKQGFTRVVVPREMPIHEIEDIKAQTGIELEVFVHGALCYCYSGQCFMSSAIGGRSGNRGLCAGPCRKWYSLADASGKIVREGYLLSPKDLNTRAQLDKLCNTGVDALKIEGRMKTPEYVFAVTKAYREALNGADEAISDEVIAQVFNRNFTTGFLLGDRHIIEDQQGKNKGIAVGVVEKQNGRELIVHLNAGKNLCVGDGIAFAAGEEGIGIDKAMRREGRHLFIPYTGGTITPGATVYRTKDAALSERLHKESQKPIVAPPETIDLKVMIKEKANVVVAITGKNMTINYHSSIVPQKAVTKPLASKIIEEQMKKLGNTTFTLGKLTVEVDEGLFLTKGELNQIRREAVEAFQVKVQPPRKLPEISITSAFKQWTSPKTDHQVISLELRERRNYEAALFVKPDEIVLPVNYGDDLNFIRKCIHSAKAQNIDSLLRFPRIIDTVCGRWLFENRESIEALGADGLLLSNYESVAIFKESSLLKEGDWNLSVINNFAAVQMWELGLKALMLSPELTGSEIKALQVPEGLQLGLGVYGHQEMMISKICPVRCNAENCTQCNLRGHYTLGDERGEAFPMLLGEDGFVRIYNGHKLFLGPELLSQKSIAKWRIYWTDETVPEMEEVIAYYRAMTMGEKTGKPTHSGVKYTQGNYKRGIV